jgi:alpha-L-fucosidase
MAVVLALVFQLGCITGLSLINRQSESRTQLLLEEMNEKNLQIDLSRKQLEGNLSQLEKAGEQETNPRWVSEGLARLSDLIRTSSGEEQLYDKLLSNIVKEACYAYNRKKYSGCSFIPGEGLVGQSYLKRDFIHLTDRHSQGIHQYYLRIR